MSVDAYRSIDSGSRVVLREKASRFIAYAFPITSRDRFKERLQEISREHHSSRHVCYAWVLGDEGEEQRSNDAGEPSGTAGRPILNRIIAMRLTYTAVVVVRYFGGTLLGKRGLIAAYGQSARMALEQVRVVERPLRVHIAIECSHARFDQIERELISMEGEVLESEFSLLVKAVVAVPRSAADACVRRWRARGIEASPTAHDRE